MTADGASYGPTENQADMITAAYKHKYTENLTWYTAVAATFNGPDAHYDLGAGGHGITTDCHDSSNASGGLFPVRIATQVRRSWAFPPACSGSSNNRFGGFLTTDPGRSPGSFFIRAGSGRGDAPLARSQRLPVSVPRV
jgi:hypothetical protein